MPYLKMFCPSNRVSQNGLFTHMILTLIYQINTHWTFLYPFISEWCCRAEKHFRLRNESIALRNVGLCVSLCARCVSHAVRPLHLSLRSCDIKCIPRRLFIHLFIGSVSVVTLNHHQKVVKTLFIEKDKFDYTVFIVKSKTCISFALDFWQSVRDSNTNKF